MNITSQNYLQELALQVDVCRLLSSDPSKAFETMQTMQNAEIKDSTGKTFCCRINYNEDISADLISKTLQGIVNPRLKIVLAWHLKEVSTSPVVKESLKQFLPPKGPGLVITTRFVQAEWDDDCVRMLQPQVKKDVKECLATCKRVAMLSPDEVKTFLKETKSLLSYLDHAKLPESVLEIAATCKENNIVSKKIENGLTKAAVHAAKTDPATATKIREYLTIPYRQAQVEAALKVL